MQGGLGVARRASSLAVGVVLALLTWRDVLFLPVDSLDPSWQAALHMAAHSRMPFEGLVFTYGPLGFLAQPVAYYPFTLLLSSLYVFGVEIALCTAFISVLRRTFPLLVAAAATLFLVRATPDVEVIDAVVVTVVVAAFGLLRGDHRFRTEAILVIAGGVVAGTHLLVKLNTGVTVFVVGAVTAWFVGRRGRPSVTIFMGAALVSLVFGWIATGNNPLDLAGFVGRSFQVASGYSEAMTIELTGRGVFYPVAIAVSVIVVTLGWRASRGWERSRQIGLALAGAMWLFAGFKLGFVRHDRHDVIFFGETLLVGAVLAAASVVASTPQTWKQLAGAATSTLLVAQFAASDVPIGPIVNPFPTLGRAASDLAGISTAQRRERAVERARANLRRRYYDLPPPVVGALSGRTVHIRPWEAGIAWAYPELRWRPLPVFQEYTAYTADLDELNASFLRSSDAPERILAEQLTVDVRNPDWESPAAVVAMVCHYRELMVEDRWQVLERVANRCGDEQSLGVTNARLGDAVAVPEAEPDMLVVARIEGLDDSPLYGLRTTLWRAPEVHVTMDGGRRHRIVPGTAPNGLIVRAPPALGFTQPYAPDSANYLRVERRAGVGLASELSIEFVAIPVLG